MSSPMSDRRRPARPLRTDRSPGGNTFVTVLSLDGGGIRGLLSARIIDWLEQRTGRSACRLFDVIAGTSTGGLLALALTKPDVSGAHPRYTASDLVELYRLHGHRIFGRSLGHFIRSMGGLGGPKYPAREIEGILKSYFGSARVSEALTSVLITSYDTATAKPYLFKNYRRPADQYVESTFDEDPLMWQAARATSAAPTYFPPFQLEAADGWKATRSLVDGGVCVNNPAMCALVDAHKLFPVTDRKFLVVSVGTGKDEIKLPYRNVKGRGLLRWAHPILTVVFDGVSDVVDYQVAELADVYYRIQEDSLTLEMDDASPEAIGQLMKAADVLVSQSKPSLEELASLLLSNDR